MNSPGFFKFLSTAIVLVSLGLQTYSQRIQYSRQNFKMPFADATKLVANISGLHHVLSFTFDEKPSIHIYDDKLQLVSKKEIQFKFQQRLLAQVIPFKDYYFLYIHQSGQPKHDFWRIDAQGNAVDVSENFQRIIDTTFKKNVNTLQLVNRGNQLFVLVNTYYKEIEKSIYTVVHIDKNLSTVSTRKIVFPLKSFEGLRQVTMFGENLIILKTSGDSTGYSLQLIKANLNTGKLLMNDFSGNSSPYTNVGFRYIAEDSSFLIYSLVRGAVFISKLDTALNFRMPVVLVKNRLANRSGSNYFFLPGNEQQCINMSSGIQRAPRTTSRMQNSQVRYTFDGVASYNNSFQRFGESAELYADRMYREGVPVLSNRYDYDNYRTSGSYRTSSAPDPPLCFSVLDKQLALLRDSLVVNGKSTPNVHPTSAQNITLHNKSYLLFTQSFTPKKQGLLLVQANGNDELQISDLMVNDNFEYLLSELQPVNNDYVIIPFRHKREMGLVKITMEK